MVSFVLKLLFLFVPFSLFAGGSTDTELQVLNKEWVLCITEFDVSALTVSEQTVGAILLQNIVSIISVVKERHLTPEEHTYYDNKARKEIRGGASISLSKKRDERDQLLFKGDPAWKHKKNLRTIDKEIAELEKKFADADTVSLLIEDRPVFKLSENNIKNIFPPRPSKGGEGRFCSNAKADAMLAGTVSSFHGRLYFTINLWTEAGNSYQYENSIIFSIEEADKAVSKLESDLIAELSGTPSAHLAINVEPEGALVALDNVLVEGGVDKSYRAGSVSIDVSTKDYESKHINVDTNPNELLTLSLSLKPIMYGLFNIEGPQASVYLGSEYLGRSPLEVKLPIDRYAYFRIENEEGEIAKTIRPAFSEDSIVSLDFKRPLESPEDLIEKNRKSFYNAFGRFWIALPIAFVMQGVSTAQTNANARAANIDLYKQATISYYISIGAWVVLGITAIDMFYNSYRYLKNAHDQSISIYSP